MRAERTPASVQQCSVYAHARMSECAASACSTERIVAPRESFFAMLLSSAANRASACGWLLPMKLSDRRGDWLAVVTLWPTGSPAVSACVRVCARERAISCACVRVRAYMGGCARVCVFVCERVCVYCVCVCVCV